MARFNRLTAVLLALLLAPVSHAAVLTFDEPIFSHGTVVDSEYAPLVGISAQNNGGGPDLAVAFDTTLSNTLDPDLEGLFDSNNPALADDFDPGNVLIIQENSTGCADGTCNAPDDEGSRPAGIITFRFTQTIELLSMDFFDIERAEDGATLNNRIRLYNSGGTELLPDTFYTPNTGGDNLWDQVVFGGISGVQRIDVYMGGSGALDNVVYNVVPIPSSVWLFGAALLGFIGFARRTGI